MTCPIAAGIAGIFVAMFSIHFCNTAGDPLSEGILRMLLVGTMAFFLYFVSREKTLQKCGVETGYVIKVLSPLLITAVFFGGIGFVDGIINKTPLQPNWISNFFLTLFELLFVGLFEEVAFRALINDAIVYQFRSFKHVFLLSAILSSLIFGYVHVMFVPLNSPLMVGQVVGKTLSTGLFEEVAFRALINDAIVYQFRSFKHVFLLSAVLSSLIFGYVHVMFVPLSSPQTAVTLPRVKTGSPFL